MSKKLLSHGVSRYTHGCRCDVCRTEWATYHRARRRAAHAGIRSRRTQSHVARTAFFQDRKIQWADALTALAVRILQAAEARTGQKQGDVIEQLVRAWGPRVRFDDETAA